MKAQGQLYVQSGRIGWSRLLAYTLGTLLFFALVLFLPAGTWAWARGWVFLLVFLPAVAVSALYLWRVNPEIYVARSRIHEGTKGWDRILIAVLLPLAASIYPVAALDDGRYHWHPLPWSVCVLGYVLMLIGLAGMTWAEAVNRFFEPGVRIQTDRGHTVIDTGPYAVIRHPGYVTGCLLFVGTALALGSLWALVPVVMASLLLILRTIWEEQTLRDELPGYTEYTRRVRYRWLPGIW